MITKDKFSGGGVLPVVNIEKDGVNIPCFIVFSSNRGVLSDAGGKVDPGEPIQKTCTREFYEESCKLFSIDHNVGKSKSSNVPPMCPTIYCGPILLDCTH